MRKVCIRKLKKGKITLREVQELKSLALKVLENEQSPQNIQIDVTLVDNDYIQALNKKYRKRDAPTDVLAFPIEVEAPGREIPLLADIYISVEKAEEQVQQGETLKKEIARLLIHGILHILGYEHSHKMFSKQEEYLAAL